jgi:hypothetical protein
VAALYIACIACIVCTLEVKAAGRLVQMLARFANEKKPQTSLRPENTRRAWSADVDSILHIRVSEAIRCLV